VREGLHQCRWPSCIACASLAMIMVTGCAAPQDGARPASDRLSGAPTPDRAERPLLREQGLAVRRVRITDDPHRIAAAFGPYAGSAPLPDELTDRLDRSGLRLILIPISELDAVLSALGDAPVDRTVWHGQATTWRPVVERTLFADDVVGVEGRLRTFDAGTMRLLMRGWTLMMEDGLHVHLELLPDLDQTRPREMDRLLGRPRYTGVRFLSLYCELLFSPDMACLLTMERPGVTWAPGAPGVGEARDGAGGSGGAEERGAESASAAGPSVDAPTGAPGPGPAFVPPRTLGEVLFRAESARSGREVIVLVPRVFIDAPAEPGEGSSS